MTALYFGDPAAPLFGVYHPATGKRRSHGIVLCHAFGAEYLLSHFAVRRVAIELAKRGHDVLRFDYTGSGDSAGEQNEVRLERWLVDIETAIDELRDTAEVSAVSLGGVRLGAGLACLVAARREDVVDAVVAWDPVLNGAAYLELLERAERTRHPRGTTEPQLLGHPLPCAFRTELERFDATAAAAGLGDRLRPVLVGGAEGEGAFERALASGDIVAEPRIVDAMVGALTGVAS
jgi:alpha-beta hydrolase superfamily lysophospholipase